MPNDAALGKQACPRSADRGRATSQQRETDLDTRQTLNRFLESVERSAYRMALVATGNREEALDIVQDAMLKLSQRYGNGNAEQWPPLFHRILQSRIRDWYRRQQVRKKWLSWFSGQEDGSDNTDPLLNTAAATGTEPQQATARQRAMNELEQAIHQLPLRQQQVLMLRLWQGLDVKDTAQAMGCSTGSVKTHYSRAVHVLREKLEDHRP